MNLFLRKKDVESLGQNSHPWAKVGSFKRRGLHLDYKYWKELNSLPFKSKSDQLSKPTKTSSTFESTLHDHLATCTETKFIHINASEYWSRDLQLASKQSLEMIWWFEQNYPKRALYDKMSKRITLIFSWGWKKLKT